MNDPEVRMTNGLANTNLIAPRRPSKQRALTRPLSAVAAPVAEGGRRNFDFELGLLPISSNPEYVRGP